VVSRLSQARAAIPSFVISLSPTISHLEIKDGGTARLFQEGDRDRTSVFRCKSQPKSPLIGFHTSTHHRIQAKPVERGWNRIYTHQRSFKGRKILRLRNLEICRCFSRSPALRCSAFPQGSDFFTIYVRPTTSPLVQREGETRVSHDDGRLPEEIRFAKFCSIIWTHDNKGFFYQVNAAILHVILCPYILSSRGTPSAFRMGKPHQTRPELKLPATSMPSCITIESTLHSVSVSYIPGFRDADLRLDVRIQLTTFWSSRIQNIPIGCGLSPSRNSMAASSNFTSAKIRLECVCLAPLRFKLWLSPLT